MSDTVSIKGDYQQFTLDAEGLLNDAGERMLAKVHAINAVDAAPDMLGKSVLDIGADHGFWSFLASSAGARRVLGLDRGREVKGRGFVDLPAENNALARKFQRHDRVRFRSINLGAQWHEFGGFDVVYCMSVLHHIYAQCGDLNSVWFWLARHTNAGGVLIWEGPLDDSDPVIRMNVTDEFRPGYNRSAMEQAASVYFDIERRGPAMHEPTREIWLCRRKHSAAAEVYGFAQAGAGGATKAFLRDNENRIEEIEHALGTRPYPGSLNMMLAQPFDWNSRYYRARISDSTDRRNPDAPWAPRWCRFYPVSVGEAGAWAMRFEGERYDERFIELIAPYRLRDLVQGGTVNAGGFEWPAAGSRPAQISLTDVEDVDNILPYVKGRSLAVQAGGNVGVFPARLAREFATVVTFEPDEKNFACLERNVTAANVVKHRAALGQAATTAGLVKFAHNSGAHFLDGDGEVRVVAIDDLDLPSCDLIYLDVEGHELQAICGAARTIRKHRPIIVFEDKGLSERYAVPKGAARDYIAAEFGYHVIGKIGTNDIMMGAAA